MVDVVGGHVMHASSVLLTLRIAQRTVQRGVRAAGRAARYGRCLFFSRHAHARTRPVLRVSACFHIFFLVLTVDVVGIYFLSHVLALILLHHPPSVLGENAGGKEAARSSRELPVGNILEEIFLSSCRKIPGTVDVLGILRGQM